MKNLMTLMAFFLCSQAHALEVFNLNVFDQLQGEWQPGFRERRLGAIADYVHSRAPGLVVFQEARSIDGKHSEDASLLASAYPYHRYVNEMPGKDGAHYGYWIGSKQKPDQWIEDGFSFPGGVPRRVQGAYFKNAGDGSCLGVLSLHLSYQSSPVRVKEAQWLLAWLKKKEKLCRRWLVLGDFNADREDAEMKVLFEGGLRSLYTNLKPTIGAFNPIRRIYGDNIPSRTIDWALGWNLEGSADVVLDTPWKNEWVSDHAAIYVTVNQGEKK